MSFNEIKNVIRSVQVLGTGVTNNVCKCDKKELLERKRVKELQRILLPDAPPRKRRMQKQSPEREPYEMVAAPLPSTSAQADVVQTSPAPLPSTTAQADVVQSSPAPFPSTSAQADAVQTSLAQLPSTSAQADAVSTSPPTPPFIVVPANVEFIFEDVDEERSLSVGTSDADTLPNSPSSLDSLVFRLPTTENWAIMCRTPRKRGILKSFTDSDDDYSYNKEVADVGSEVELTAVASTSKPRRRSVIGSNTLQFDDVVTDWLTIDSDSDVNMDDDNDEPSPLPRQVDHTSDCDLTPQQMEILEAEDSANDRAIRNLLPEDSFTFDWTRDRTTFTSQRETFMGVPGPTFDLNEDTRPTDIFDKMFDVEFIDLLCIETNRYAQQKIKLLTDSNKIGAKSRLHSWTPTDRPEMISFLALMIIQGLYPLPIDESYFTFNGFGTMPYISKIMTYNRYILLKSMFHFVDNDSPTDLRTKSKLCKIAPIIDYFNEKFSSLYYPHQEIAIDESLLKWHGRLNFAQKINTKAAQVGVKTYELCESSSGYLWRFSVYTGKSMTTTTNDDNNEDDDNDNRRHQTERTTDTDFRPTNATAKIVFDLIEPLLHRGHTVIMDNFYNSPLLARCLKRRQTDCFGTQRLNREFVPSSIRTMSKSDLRHGEIVATYCSDLSLMVWRDSNLVSMISTYHPLQVGTREKYNRTAYKPSVVLDYNKSMGGIDRKDQYLSAHPIERVRSHVWYKKLFRRFFNCAVFNCFVIFSTKHKLQHRQFRTVLVESLLKTYRQNDLTTETRLISRTYGQTTTTIRQRNSSLKLQDRPIVESDHFPVHASVKRGRCWWCAHTRQVTSRTIWKCKECDVNLCILGCFRDYHKP